MDVFRFITAGNVDDGKSTLIGRLLHDTGNIKSDILTSVSDSDSSVVNLAHITDGLRAERAQGITIDVAYKYLTTEHRKFIITDAPGHFQYTKNLVTGASGTDAIIVLIDATHGITEQTRRHSLVAAFLRIPHVVVAVNKMDAMGFDEAVFGRIQTEYEELAAKLGLTRVTYIPMSALLGDNVTFQSDNMGWYKGNTLLQYLESCEPVVSTTKAIRFCVQHVVATNDEVKEGYLGKLLSGTIRTNDMLTLWPEQQTVIVSKITEGYNTIREASAGANLCLQLMPILNPTISIKRGAIVANKANGPTVAARLTVRLCWLNGDKQLSDGEKYVLRINCQETPCKISTILSKTAIGSFEEIPAEGVVSVNEFAFVRIETDRSVVFDTFTTVPENGRGVLIDPDTNYTSAAFIVGGAQE
jgi:sulfate adenylyltransferase subunit 1